MTVQQISIPFLLYTHLVPIVVAIAFGAFLLFKTKKLSAFYLLLVCVSFSMYALFDLMAWTPNDKVIMFSWSIFDIFSTGFFILSYWFLYEFVKERDLPMWQKVLTSCALIPTLVITAMNINMDTLLQTTIIPNENQLVTNYNSILEILFIILIVAFTVAQYRKAIDVVNKNKIVLAGVGVVVFLFIFFFVFAVTNFIISINLWNLASTSYVYNISPYAILGMPVLLAFLGYLIAKYQAFDMKLIKSVVYMVALMIILFIGLFVV